MIEEKIKKIIENTLNGMSVTFSGIEIGGNSENDQKIFVIKTEESGLLIGEDGEHFNALFHIIKRLVEKELGNELRFSIDINDYRSSKIDKLKLQAGILANRARDMKSNVEMDPMSSYERLVVHSALAEEANIKTESIGFGRDRRIVIKYIEN